VCDLEVRRGGILSKADRELKCRLVLRDERIAGYKEGQRKIGDRPTL